MACVLPRRETPLIPAWQEDFKTKQSISEGSVCTVGPREVIEGPSASSGFSKKGRGEIQVTQTVKRNRSRSPFKRRYPKEVQHSLASPDARTHGPNIPLPNIESADAMHEMPILDLLHIVVTRMRLPAIFLSQARKLLHPLITARALDQAIAHIGDMSPLVFSKSRDSRDLIVIRRG